MDGFLLVDKPKGITSFSLCNKIKYNLKLEKTGHSGTLDPNASGLMLVAVNRATKLLKLFNYDDKAYIATIAIGLDSDTLDMDTKNISKVKMNVTLEAIKEALLILKNKKTQIPPMTSAIKINGKKLYEYQRQNIDVELKERNVQLFDYEIKSDLAKEDDVYYIDIYLHVSKGFYIRSLARDLGELLNGKAILKDLRRISIGNFNINDSIKLEDLSINNIIPITSILKFDKLEVNDYIAHLVSNGITLDERQIKTDKVFYVTHNNDIIAIYEPVDKYKYKPILILEKSDKLENNIYKG